MGIGSRRGRRLAAGALAFALVHGALGPREAAAQDRFNTRVGRVTNGFFYRFTTAARVNPLGLFLEARGGWRHRLFDPGHGPLILRNTYFAIAPSVVLSPAFVRPGVAVEFSPLAILNLSALVEYVQYFGSFNLAQTWEGAGARYSNAAVFGTAPGRDGNGETARGLQLNLSALLQARAGELVVRSNFRGIYMNLAFSNPANNLAGTDLAASRQTGPVFYDQFFDALAPTNGWLFANDSDLLYQGVDYGITFGVRFTAVMPLYTSRELAGAADDGGRTTMRVGPIFAYTFKEQRHAAFNAPSIFALAQWWIQHPFRTEGVGAAMPMIVVGLSFRGDS